MDSAKPQILGDSSENKTEAFADRFEILGELGCGGMSVVYRAREILLDRVVALKVLNHAALRESKMMQRFRNEAKACSTLQHPNIVQVLSSGIANTKQPYLVMELLEGRTLEQELRENGCLNKDKFQEIFLPVMDALIYAHSKNMVHRDLKPSNIMLLDDAAGGRQVKVVDFGIAKIIEDEQSSDTQATVGLLGSPLYMSPEQCSGGKIDHRSDIYSLACVMYEAIVGKPPFSGETLYETMYEHLKKSVPKLAEISGSLNISKALFDAIIEALAKDPGRRPADMRAFRDNVAIALNRQDRMKRPVSLAARLQGLVYLLSGLVLLVVVPVVFFAQRPHESSEGWQKKPERWVGSADNMSILVQIRALRDAGKPDLALKKCQEAFMRAESNPKGISGLYTELAWTYSALGQKEKGIETFRKGINMFDNPLAASRFDLVKGYADYLKALGRIEEANKMYADALNVAEQSLPEGDTSPTLAHNYNMFAEMLYVQKKYKEAALYAAKSLKYYDRLVETRCTAGGVLCTSIYVKSNLALGNKSAIDEYRKTTEELKREFHPDPEVDMQHAHMLLEAGLYDDAEWMYRLAEKHIGKAKPLRRKDVMESIQKELLELARIKSKQRSTGNPGDT